MIYGRPTGIESASSGECLTVVDFSRAMLSDRDENMRRQSAAAPGVDGDTGTVEPLMFALVRELSSGAESFTIALDILASLEKQPDSRALDLLLNIESRLIDHDSPGCREGMPVGSIVYSRKDGGHNDWIVPRRFHYKVFQCLRRISAALGDRTELVADRFHAYQQVVMGEEVDRLVPMMTKAIEETKGPDLWLADRLPVPVLTQSRGPKLVLEHDECEAVAVQSFDHERIRQESETQIMDYIRNNEDMQSVILHGQRLKACIRRAREEKVKLAPENTLPSEQAYVR